MSAFGHLAEKVKISWPVTHQASAGSEVDGTGVDMAGYDGVLFIGRMATPNATNTIKVQQGADNSVDWQDLTGTSVSSGSSDEIIWVDVYRPTDRYVRPVILRAGGSSVVDSVVALQYNGRTFPVDNTITGTIAGECHVSPAEGTA